LNPSSSATPGSIISTCATFGRAGGGQEWEFGTRRPYPIGSCFKVALLMAVFDAMDAEEMDRPLRILPQQHVDAGGVIKLFDSEISLTPHQLCQLILTASDATATDILIERVGLGAVDRILRKQAPDSHIGRNLADMMRDFRAMPESTACKQRDWDDAELSSYADRVAELGATHAHDLASLMAAAWTYQPKPELRDYYRRCLDNRARILTRSGMFANGRWLLKGGTIGYTFFINDCGLIFGDDVREPLALFGWCAAGSRLPGFVMETIAGEIGLHMLDALGIERPSSPDWTAAGSAVLNNLGR
jgi:hypothetical protein